MDREKVIKELTNLPTTIYGGFYQLRITHDLRNEVIALLNEQETVEHACDILRANGWKETEPICSECDAVHVVRCQDCEYMKVMPCDIHGHIPIYCTNLGIYSEGLTWFCADGERKSTDEKLMDEMDADPLG